MVLTDDLVQRFRAEPVRKRCRHVDSLFPQSVVKGPDLFYRVSGRKTGPSARKNRPRQAGGGNPFLPCSYSYNG
jgi:hypothetical protein